MLKKSGSLFPTIYKLFCKQFALALTFSCLSMGLNAQQFNGFIHSDFSGILGARVQPASIADSPYKWDVSLVNANVFITNNIAFLRNEGETSRIIRFIDDKQKFLQTNFSLGGLSAMISLPRKQSIGLQYRIRGHVSGTDISPDFISQVNRFTDIRFLDSEASNQSGQIAASVWRELSFTYAKVVSDDGFNRWKAGVTVKRINSYGSLYAQLNELDYQVTGAGLSVIDSIDFDIGYSANLDPFEEFGGNESFSGLPPANKANYAFDLGVVLERMASRPSPKNDIGTRLDPDIDYVFRMSASITDLGVMEFAEGEFSTSFQGLVPGVTNPSLNSKFNDAESFQSLVDSLGTVANATQRLGRYRVTLPTALHLNYDYNFGNNWYVNANALVDLTALIPADYRLRYLHNITITPRYEESRRGAYFPLYFNQIGDFHVGLAARLGVLTLGTQNIGGLLAREKRSIGFFFSLNLNQLVANSKKPYCFGRTRGTATTRTKRTPLYKRKKFLFF